MRKLILLGIALCALLCLTGCEKDIENAAYEANKAITAGGNVLDKPRETLNSVVDDFMSKINF